MIPALLVAAGYLSGSVPYGLLLARLVAGKDVRTEGSGNIGATNVARVVGKKLGAVVLILDALKGALPVLAAQHLLPGEPLWHDAVGLAAFFGHVFPVWLKFKGGKGVATALGVLVVLLPWAALAGFLVWALVLAIFRVSSVGSLAGAVVAVAVGFLVHRPIEYPAVAVVFLVLMLFTHRSNLQRLINRQENKV
ncbi:MAG: glycerol-3-phosphate acyltransferase [Myxococcaceae bacterium]|nr:glycerol-3-phosphate acyltransferase [Myxococcaceae bacterium]